MMDTQSELKAASFLVILQSEEFGNEFFKKDTLAEALASIGNIAKEVLANNDDGFERIIGLVVNPCEYGVLGGLEADDCEAEFEFHEANK